MVRTRALRPGVCSTRARSPCRFLVRTWRLRDLLGTRMAKGAVGRSGGRSGTVGIRGGMDDPHEVLGVSRDATAEQVGRRFRELVPRHHADRAVHATPQERRVAHERMSSITEAFRMLNDVAELMRYRRLVPAREARTPRSWVVTGCTSGLVIRRPGVGSNPRRATRTSTSAVGPRASSSSATAPTNPACGPPARSRHAAGGVGDDWCRPCHRPARRWASGGEAEAGR